MQQICPPFGIIVRIMSWRVIEKKTNRHICLLDNLVLELPSCNNLYLGCHCD